LTGKEADCCEDVETALPLFPEKCLNHVGKKSKGIYIYKKKKKNNNNKYVPLALGALRCSENGELKPLEILASKKSSLGIEAE
jgi:hypothetical protein